ncbi:MAG TPA: cation:proton antiporter [Terriglobia bacterium]|jgi:Kef-type K+ transport system membrane component KefB|nr:cation:proton antiporter [Terriglobia bacterium]
MDHTVSILLELLLMFAGGKLLAELMERARQPAVVGELLAGVVLGPSLLGLIHPGETTHALAEIGAIFLLFTVGLETKPSDLLNVGWTATLVATLGVVLPFVLGFAYVHLASHNLVESFFVAAAMVATSVGITARVLSDLGALSTRVARVILGAAVLDDVLGMIVLAVVSSLSTGEVNYLSLAIVTLEAIGFSLFVLFFGSRVVGRFRPAVARLQARNSAFALSVILCLGLSLASVYIGMAAIIGAFLAGLALADHSEHWQLEENARPISEFLTPFFFVLLGAQVNLRTIAQPGLPVMITVICILAILSKLLGCGLGALSLGLKDATRIGIGMVPRGEVGLIVAAVGLRLHTISDAIYTVVVVMSIVTTLFAPPVLRLLISRKSAKELQDGT